MKKSNYIFISILILTIGGVYIFNQSKKNKLTKEESILVIVGNGFSENINNALSSFDEDFLYNWANAVKDKTTTFLFKDKKYYTQGGSSVKK